MKKKRMLIFVLIIVIAVLGIKILFGIDYSIYRLSVPKDVRLRYINAVDKVSYGKIQVNWREVMGVDATLNYGNIETATENNINRIAERFISQNNKGYELRSIEGVVESFGGNKEDVKKAQRYLKVINDERDVLKEFKKEFINELKEEAINVSKKTGILPSVIIGQAALESNWGRSNLSSKYYNFFGIKADSSWKGKKVNLPTSEYYNTKIKDDFRVYNNVSESLKDYGDFLVSNPRYKKAKVFYAKTYKQQIKAIENAGYSTITNEKGEQIYAEYVIDIIMSSDLQLLDWEMLKG